MPLNCSRTVFSNRVRGGLSVSCRVYPLIRGDLIGLFGQAGSPLLEYPAIRLLSYQSGRAPPLEAGYAFCLGIRVRVCGLGLEVYG